MGKTGGAEVLNRAIETTDHLLGFSQEPVSAAGKAYILAIIALGIPILAYCLLICLASGNWPCLLLIGASAILACLPLGLNRVHDKIGMTLCDVFVFLAIFLYGPEFGVAAAAAESLAFNFKGGVKRAYRHLFNVSQIGIVAAFAGHVFYLMRKTSLLPRS